MQSPIENYCPYISIDDNPKKQSIPKLLLQVYIRELFNIMVSSTEQVGLEEASDEDNIIIIIDSTLQNIIPPQLKNMTPRYKVMCVC